MASKQAVVIVGATGYVGSHLVSLLGKLGFDVRCIVRRSADKSDLDYLRSCGASIFTGDLANIDPATNPAFSGAGTAINLIGSIAPKRGVSFHNLHAGQMEALVGQCIVAKVPKVIMLSALGAAENAGSAYHVSKWQAEQTLQSVAIKHVIVRPSLIVGHETGQRHSKLVKRYIDLMAKHSHVPLIAGGTNKIQPIFIGDLCQALVSLIKSNAYDGKTLELGGPDIVTMRQFVQSLMAVLGLHKPLSSLPAPLAWLAALVCQMLQEVPIVSTDQVRLSTIDNVCRENRLPALLDKRPTSLEQALSTYKNSHFDGLIEKIS